ncbi:MAG: HPr family phosphocarrier protein [Sphingobium sp.]
MSEISREVRIENKRGLHARASAKFVTLASSLPAHISVSKAGSSPVAGTSIMGLMMLGAAMGDSIVISASGTEAQGALDKLVRLVEDKFGED